MQLSVIILNYNVRFFLEQCVLSVQKALENGCQLILSHHPLIFQQLKNITNAIGAIHEQKLFAVSLYNRSINGDIFHDWVANKLIPELPKDSVIVMDNATFHKRKDTQELIQKEGHTLLYLPPYSPNFNFIEQTWAWIKQKRKEWRIHCIDDLFFYFMWICGCF